MNIIFLTSSAKALRSAFSVKSRHKIVITFICIEWDCYEILRLGVLWRQSKLSCCQIRVSSVYRLSCRSVATSLKKIGRTSWKLQILTCWKVIIYRAPATCSDLFRALSAWVCTSFQPFIIFFRKNSNPNKSIFLVREINSSIMNKWYLIKKLVHR